MLFLMAHCSAGDDVRLWVRFAPLSQIPQDMQTTHTRLCRDVSNPLPESIDLLEDMVVEYVVEMVTSPCRLRFCS
jgi:hypothetical protein